MFFADYSPDATHGEFFRAVVSHRTTRETIDRLVAAIEQLGSL
jgi:threonine aldolase